MRRHIWSVLLGVCVLTGCGGGGGSGGGVSTPPPAVLTNLTALTVGPGPNGQNNINIPYANVMICQPNTSTCATINGLLVDTGSYGIRVLASALASAGLTLPNTADPANANNTLAECIPFVDGYTWGPLATATIKINGETASSIPINVLNDNNTYNPTVPTACTSLTSNTSLDSLAALHANGILGVGIFPDDCGQGCETCASAGGGCTDQNDVYYSCNSTANVCTPTPVPETAQTRNPVVSFTTDNNGVIIELPSIAASGSASVSGSLIFGIGTQSNNGLGGAAVLTLSQNSFFTTTFNGQTLNSSFIDSGSNAYYFADASLATCSGNTDFYCPASTVTLSATNQGGNGIMSNVSFQVANLNTLSNTNFAFNDVAGTAATSTGTDMLNNDFDFGLPFFFGRHVFIAIDGAAAGGTTGPYYAY
ncbi:MAG TPA: DUF3443 family protein [Steroidobacteraceae bacterium]|jgi:hypothetical protein|nr:DUF3443 family protein [Steroidobacteraceae bacterium]